MRFYRHSSWRAINTSNRVRCIAREAERSGPILLRTDQDGVFMQTEGGKLPIDTLNSRLRALNYI
jgi:hypothetical protein